MKRTFAILLVLLLAGCIVPVSPNSPVPTPVSPVQTPVSPLPTLILRTESDVCHDYQSADVTNDGKVDLRDWSAISHQIDKTANMAWTVTAADGKAIRRMDVNCDGRVDAADADLVRQAMSMALATSEAKGK
jgi:uncharacterized lipoprotein YajG